MHTGLNIQILDTHASLGPILVLLKALLLEFLVLFQDNSESYSLFGALNGSESHTSSLHKS